MLLATGARTFAAPLASPLQLAFAYDITVADFDGDGHVDVAVTSTAAVEVLHGAGDGTFAPGTLYTATGGSLATADVTGDGTLDLIAGLNVLRGRGDGTFELPTAPTAAGTTAVADFDGDGVLDLASSVENGTAIDVLHGNGDGTFAAGPGTPASPGNTSEFAAADLSGDGKSDVVVDGPDEIVAYLGGITRSSYPRAFRCHPTALALGDLDGDGLADVVTSDTVQVGTDNLPTGQGVTIEVRLSQAGGVLLPFVLYQVGTEPLGVAIGDVDNDGVADVAVAVQAGSVALLYGK